MNLQNLLIVLVADNGMYPLIKEREKVYVDPQYKNNSGDLVAVKLTTSNYAIIRKIEKQKNQIVLKPISKYYPSIVLNNCKDLEILGKVIKGERELWRISKALEKHCKN